MGRASLTLAVVALVTLAGLRPSEAIIIDWVDSERGIAKGRSATHDFLLPPGSDHGGPVPQTEAAHFSWVPSTPPPGTLTTVDYFIHSHAGADALSGAQIARIQDAATVWNTSGALVMLNQLFSDAAADIHVHGDSTSGCAGPGTIGCAELAWFLAHNPAGYADGHPQHLMVSNTAGFGILQELTMLTRTDWYTGADTTGIAAGELDYLSVVIQEFGHHLGLAHNDLTTGHPVAEFSISPMNGSLPFGVTRRILQPSDIAAITHLYGIAAVWEPRPRWIVGLGLLVLALTARRIRTSESGT